MDEEAGHDRERTTFLERAIERIPLPYWVSCILLGILMSLLGFYLLLVALTADPVRSFQLVYTDPASGASPNLSSVRLVLFVVLNTAVNAYVFLAVRTVRVRTARAERAVAPLLPDGTLGFRRVFGRIVAPVPPLALAVVIGIAFVPFARPYPMPIMAVTGSIVLVAYVAWQGLFCVTMGTAIWSYICVLWGLHEFGHRPLRLCHASEDPWRGLRPLGALSLSLSTLYFAGVGLAMVMSFLPDQADPVYLAFLSGLAAVGAAMFLLPLASIHVQMARVKAEELGRIRRRLLSVVEGSGTAEGGSSQASLADLKKALEEVRDTTSYYAAERKISSLPTWPFDTAILGRLTAILTTIMVTIVARILIDRVLHI